MARTRPAPWASSFEVEGDPQSHIELKQLDGKSFELCSSIIYLGETGLEGSLDEATIDALRSVSPERLPETDLASVPLPLRWLASNYGVHTPAALIHDWMITSGPPVMEGLTPQYADRYFRYMLKDVGVRWLRRWMMWAAVAMRTRWETGARHRIMLIAWIVAALVGLGAFAVGILTTNLALVVVASIAPFVFACLWGRQYGAGLVASINAVWVLPPTLLGMVGYGIYSALEWIISRFSRRESSDRPFGYEDF